MAVAIVTRKSTMDEHRVSVTRQEKLGREWAGDRETRVYTDNATSGVDMERPGWLAFCADVRAGRIDEVWCYEQSRLTRAGAGTWDQVAIMLARAGIEQVHTHNQGAISVVEGNRIHGRLMAVIDQEQRERVIVHVRDAMRSLASEGRPAGGLVYGYTRGLDKHGRKTLIPDPRTAPVVREIIERVARAESLAAIAASLNERRIPTARSAPVWKTQHVRSVASRPTPAGIRGHHDNRIPAIWDPIVDRATWERAQTVLADSRTIVDRIGRLRRVPRSHRVARRYLLTGGIARCGRCGSPLIAATRGARNGVTRPAIYQCHVNTGPDACSGVAILAEPLEAHVVALVLDRLSTPATAAAFGDTDSERARLIAEVEGVRARARKLAEDYAAGLLTEDAYGAGRDTTAARLAALEEHLGALRTWMDGADLKVVAESWESSSLAMRRQAIALLVESVTITRAVPGTRRFDPNRVRVRWVK